MQLGEYTDDTYAPDPEMRRESSSLGGLIPGVRDRAPLLSDTFYRVSRDETGLKGDLQLFAHPLGE
jgi:hypothetical protein